MTDASPATAVATAAVANTSAQSNTPVVLEYAAAHPSPSVAASKESADPPQDIPIGASFILAAFFCTALMSAIGKEASALPTAMIVFFQSLVSLTLFLPWSLGHGISGIETSKLPLHLVRAIGGLLSQALMFIAIRHMPLMNTVLLSNAAPLFIPLVALLWLHERVSAQTWLSLIVGFIGVVLILKPSPELLHNPSALIATAAAVCSAIALVTVNRLSATEPARRILFYYFFLATLCAAPFLPHAWRTPTRNEWLMLLSIGGLQALSQLLIIRAYHYARPEKIAPFNYSVVIFSGILGWIMFGAKPGWLAVAGVALVCVGGVFTSIKAGPNARGHFGWIGHWNALLMHRRHQEKQIAKATATVVA